MIDFGERRSEIASSPVKVCSLLFALRTMRAQPAEMNRSPDRSYLMMNYSLRMQEERVTEKMMPRVAFTP